MAELSEMGWYEAEIGGGGGEGLYGDMYVARLVLGPSVTVFNSARVGEGTDLGETCFSLR